MAADSTIPGLSSATPLTGTELFVLSQGGVTVNITAALLAARGILQTLTFNAAQAWDVSQGNMGILTLTGNATLSAPTNLQPGSYLLIVTQDATGNRTMSFASAYKWAGGFAPVLSTAANAIDILSFVSDGTYMYGSAQKAFA